MTPDKSENRLTALKYQNQLLLAQTEALRVKLNERNEEIARLSAMLIEKTPELSNRPGLLKRLRLRWR